MNRPMVQQDFVIGADANRHVILRAMVHGDIPRGTALCRANGWNQTAADWEQLLALGADGCLAAEIADVLVGTLTAVRYQRQFAWIGMVLVERAMRGRGIATALMNHALTQLDDVPARLDATPAGQPVYGRLGFVEESRLCRMTREATSTLTTSTSREWCSSREMNEADLGAVLALDREVFGADRGRLLRWAFDAARGLARVVEGGSGLRGYCLGRPGFHWAQVGPIVADDQDAGIDLLSSAAANHGPLVVDASCARRDWIERLVSLGFLEQRPFIRMRRGVAAGSPGPDERQLAIFGPEWG